MSSENNNNNNCMDNNLNPIIRSAHFITLLYAPVRSAYSISRDSSHAYSSWSFLGAPPAGGYEKSEREKIRLFYFYFYILFYLAYNIGR